MKSKAKKKVTKKSNKLKKQAKNQKLSRYLAGFVFVFAFILYGNTLNHDYVLDDDIVTRKNAFVQKGFSGLKDIFTHGYLYGFNGKNDQSYRPLVLANLAVETQIFGSKPSVHHFFNVLFYALSGVVLLFLMFHLFKGKSVLVPLAVTLLFISHPIHTEVVANIKSRDEVLSFLFVVTSLWALMKHAGSGDKRFLILSVFAYFLCVLAKETGLAMLGLVPFSLWFFTQKDLKEITITSIYFAGAAAVYFLIRASVMDSMTFEEGMSPINNSLMAAENGLDRFATNFSIMGRYIKLMFIPYPLSYDYSYNQIPIIGVSDWKFLLSFGIYLAMAIVALTGLLKKQVSSFGIIVFVVLLLLVSNFLTMVGAPMAERFVYGSTLGFCIILGYYLFKLFNALDAKTDWKSTPSFILIGIILIYSIITIGRNQAWKNPETLFTSGLKTAPKSARAQNHYASFLRDKVEQDPTNPEVQTWANNAENAYLRALEIYPQYTEASYNLGVLYFSTNRPDQALKAYERTLAADQNYTSALNNIGVIYFNRGDYQNALQNWSRVLQIEPNNSQAMGNLGALNQNSGNLNEAVKYYEQALSIDPYNVNILNNIVKAHNSLGQPEKAAEYQARLSQMNQ